MKVFRRISRLVGIFVKDKNGRTVLWQFPNIFLIGWMLSRVGSRFISGDALATIGYLGSLFLTIWAVLEIIQGSSYFRRALGGVVLIAILASVIFS